MRKKIAVEADSAAATLLLASYGKLIARYYSANRLVPNKDVDAALPHVTIELPVSKESLEQTIAPSVYSLKKAMQTYARQGETLVIFVHDDGIQLISEEKRQERIAFYAKHNIRWVARSKHDNTPGGSKRADPFKKVSNMNHGLALSSKLEKHLKVLENAVARNALAKDQSGCLEGKALQRKRETMDAMEVILLIGNDGLRIVYEMLLVSSRNVQKLLSHSMNQMLCKLLAITSRMVFTHFTRRINKCISIGCANGEVTPFVWHDAFLRWTALQGAAFIDPADNVKKILNHEVWLACTVVSPGVGDLGFTLLGLGHRSFLGSLIEKLTWIPFFIHLTQAILAHMFSYNITWGATKEEV
ncbi:hypothetical protein SERLADRAFT_409474 [Serpula lacrymans var. lacrymans S7.9]|uniref:Uncharacterized protein n=1 Tax=Serpula lacrymans var. lacrymans (strain S7.9) TaxID=578457 RepID=F8P1E7_SERL9|nr:uncharacterized protein SERLADRAFT_409474 [Serpula lacrymans var. lacrymans S7.9]EGO22976.1 hypothetical protein SERLADRAFT_409474 [Serpula lacrymans var. lacrymans S7.9]